MKYTLKKNLKATILLVFVIFTSCEKNLYDDALKEHPLLVQKLKYSDLVNRKSKIINKVVTVKKQQEELSRGANKTIAEYANDFYIDLDNVLFIQQEGKETYTFKIQREGIVNVLENLIFTSNEFGDYDVFLAQYKDEILTFNSTNQGEITDAINSNALYEQISNDEILPNYIVKQNADCFEPGYILVSEVGDSCASGQHTFADGQTCDYWGTTGMATPGSSHYVFTMLSVPCDNAGGATGTNNGFATGPHGGALILNNSQFNALLLQQFVGSFTDEQQIAWWYDSNNAAAVAGITQYLNSHGYSLSNLNIVSQLIDICAANNLEIDFNVNNNNLQTVNTASDLNAIVQTIKEEIQDSNTGTSNTVGLNQMFCTRTISLTSIHQLTIELVCNKQPFSLVNSSCVSYLNNIVLGNDWVQNSISLLNDNYSPTDAQVLLVGYINVGINFQGLRFGIKLRKKVKLQVNKTTGIICCTITENIN